MKLKKEAGENNARPKPPKTALEQYLIGVLEAKRLHAIGRSLMVILPKTLMEIYTAKIVSTDNNGNCSVNYFVRIRQDGRSLIITPVGDEEIEALPPDLKKEYFTGLEQLRMTEAEHE